MAQVGGGGSSAGGAAMGSSTAAGIDLSSGEDPAPPVEFSFADDPNPKHRPQNEDAHIITCLLESEEFSVGATEGGAGGSAEYAPRSFDGLKTPGAGIGSKGEASAAIRYSGSFTGLETYKDAASTQFAKGGALARSSRSSDKGAKKKTQPLAARLVRPIHMFAILDGHGGKACAAYCAEKLVEVLQQKLCKHKRWASALPEAFQETDRQFHRAMPKDTSGSTCAAGIIHGHGEKRELVLAHVGDSRIVVWDTESGGGHARRLTTDHTPAVRAEVDRLESDGGFVARGRVMGVLAVTRAFGNWEMKKQSPSHPDVSRIRLGLPPPKRSDRFLIIACDGLWDVISDTDACKVVRAHLKKGGRPELAAKVLVQEAMARRTTDNVTVLVVYC